MDRRRTRLDRRRIWPATLGDRWRASHFPWRVAHRSWKHLAFAPRLCHLLHGSADGRYFSDGAHDPPRTRWLGILAHNGRALARCEYRPGLARRTMLDYEALRVIWWLLLGVLLIGFAITDGFDLGVGATFRFLGRTDAERRVLLESVSGDVCPAGGSHSATRRLRLSEPLD